MKRTAGFAGVRHGPRLQILDLKDCRLAEVPIASWGGFVFIRYTRDGLSLANTLSDLPDVFRDYASSDFRCVRRREFVVRSNWKFLIENALEAYHTGTVHRASLGRQLAVGSTRYTGAMARS